MNSVDRERLDMARAATTRLIEGIRTIHNEPRDSEDVRILALLEEASSSLEAAELIRLERVHDKIIADAKRKRTKR